MRISDWSSDVCSSDLAGLVLTRALPCDRPSDLREGQLDELAHRMGFAGGQYIVVRPVLLQDPPHAVDIVPCVSPIALRVEIAEVEMALQPLRSEARRVGKECGSTCRYRGWRYK